MKTVQLQFKLKPALGLWALAISAIFLFGFSKSTTSQPILYGHHYKIENTWENKGAYLDVNGAGCQGNYLCVSSTTLNQRKTINTSDWIILSASGIANGNVVKSGDLIHLKNPWGLGSYLGVKGLSSENGCMGKYCVSTYTALDPNGKTTWRIVGTVSANGAVTLESMVENGAAGELDINGDSGKGGYNVCTAADQRKNLSTTVWKLKDHKTDNTPRTSSANTSPVGRGGSGGF